MHQDFEIKILRLHWVKDDDLDDPDDLCIHGEVFLRIGNQILSDQKSGSWSIGATGLFLMRTLDVNYNPGDFNNQLLPCCGHFMIPDKTGENYVAIQGCNTGIEWSIKHDNNSVKWVSESNEVGTISKPQYQSMILRLIEEIEMFYSTSEPKNIPNEHFDQEAWRQFNAEWDELKKQFHA